MKTNRTNTLLRFFTTFTLALLVGLLFNPASAQDIERTFDVSPGDRLELNLKTGGSVTVTGWDRNEVEVHMYPQGRDADEVNIDIGERSSGVYVRTENYGRNSRGGINVEVNVPRRYDVEVETMGGSITIRDVEGTFEGQTMGGELELSGLKGRVELSTMGGEISLTDSEVDGSVHTMGGEVFIADVVGNVKGTTMGGEVTYSNVKASTRSGATHDEVRIKTMGGDVNVDQAMYGANLHTMGGDIRVSTAGEYVKGTTMGGDISVDEIDGWVELNTMGGDIEVRMVGNPDDGDRHVELTSMGGDIELTVPDGLSMEVDIEITYTRNARRTPKIVSDFGIEKEMTEEWEDHDGSPRKYIYGTGSIAGGEHRVRIRTINGNVYLKAR